MLILFGDLVKHSKNSIIHTPSQLRRLHKVRRHVCIYMCKLGVCTYTIWVVTEPSTLLFWKVVMPPTWRHSHNSMTLHSSPTDEWPRDRSASRWTSATLGTEYRSALALSHLPTLLILCYSGHSKSKHCFFKHSLSKNRILATNFVKLKSVGSISTINWEKSYWRLIVC